jgi:hypothetical protein
MEMIESGADVCQYPMSAPEVAKQEGCALRTVQNWAAKKSFSGIAYITGVSQGDFFLKNTHVCLLTLNIPSARVQANIQIFHAHP